MSEEITPATEYIDLDEMFDLEGWLDGMTVDAGRGAVVLRTPVWLMDGLTQSVPAALQVAGDHIALGTVALPLFRVGLADLEDVQSPWWWFGGGIRFRADDKSYRISFVRPRDADDAMTRFLMSQLRPTGGGSASSGVAREARAGRAMGRTWRALLSGHSPRPSC
ncbi:MAG: hypothetical protein HRU14_16135 [Planctomycetes bacterium]|nr:hypothetical protein [Planctomycetota bacterium]